MSLKEAVKQRFHATVRKLGYDVVRAKGPYGTVDKPDYDAAFRIIRQRCERFTLTSPDRMYATYKAAEYVARYRVSGAVVECGVWKGGSMMICALTLLSLGDATRSIYLFDTFKGMPKPGKSDVAASGPPAETKWLRLDRGTHSEWAYGSLDEVKRNLYSTDYPRDKLVFVEGMVEDTIPQRAPTEIALLRLDTDFYESTYHELTHLFPRLVPGGVVIIDDYGSWSGAREATEQFLRESGSQLLLHKADGARIGVKAG